jgi:hypothetical protein
MVGFRAPWLAMGELAGEGREGEGEGRGTEATTVGRRKGGRATMERGCMEEGTRC